MCILNITGDYVGLSFVRWSPCGNYLISAAHDYVLRIWDANTGQLVKTLSGHNERIMDANFSPDGRYIVSASGDKSLRLWGME